MRSVSRWSRWMAAILVAAFGLAACEDEDKVLSPIEDTTPPSVTITSVSHTPQSLTVSIRAEDYISVAFIISEICCDASGNPVSSDTSFTVGRAQLATLTTEYGFPEPVTQPTDVLITAIGVDSSGNRAQRQTGYTVTP